MKFSSMRLTRMQEHMSGRRSRKIIDHEVQKLFWLDVAEPEYSVYASLKNYRYRLQAYGERRKYLSKYYHEAFYDGMTAEGDTMPISLIRSAWAGSAKYGAR